MRGFLFYTFKEFYFSIVNFIFMIPKIKRIVHGISVRIFPSYMGYIIRPKGEGYFDAKTIVKEAVQKGLSVPEYLETTNRGGVGKRRDEIISCLQDLNVLPIVNRIVEIGAGTGMYLEKFLEICKPAIYEVYETNPGWVNYLQHTFSTKTKLKVHNAKGDSLHETANDSADIISAHGVFVYIPVIITFQYLQEAVRVCKQNGYIIFDCFTDRIFTVSEILEFRKKNPGYDFPVIIKEQMIEEFCTMFNLEKFYTFDVNYHYSKSTYFILKKL